MTPFTHTARAALATLLVASVSACGGSGGGDTMIDDPVVGTSPIISAADVRAASDLIDDIDGRRNTPTTSVLPTGTAKFTGQAVGGLEVFGYNGVDGLIGDVELTADLLFAGDDVEGTISNIHTLNGETPVERLGGTLNISGDLDDGTKRMTATLSGDLDGVFGGDERGTVSLSNGNIGGRTQDTRTGSIPIIGTPIYDTATGIAGTFSGEFSGDAEGEFSGDWAVTED